MDYDLMLGEKSKTLKRRLRRERMAMQQAGEYIPFKVERPIVEPGPKMTNSAKRAARKRKKLALQEQTWIENGDSNVSTLVEQEVRNNILQSTKANKHIKFNGDELASGKATSDTTVDLSTITQENEDIVSSSNCGSSENNDKIPMKKAKLGESPDEAKKDLPPKKRRYVLFVGNLPYEVTEADVKEHFKKIGPIISVRLAKHKDSNSCRGFCHLEVSDEETYLKALSLNHTFMAKRRINVEYSCGQAEERGELKRKNFKLQTLNKTGRLGASKLGQNKSAVKVKSKPILPSKGAFFV